MSIRAGAVAAALAGSCMAAPAVLAAECRIGAAVTIETPVCSIRTAEALGEPTQAIEWEDGGIFRSLIVVTLTRPTSIKGYLARWRHHHKCAATTRPFDYPVPYSTRTGAARTNPPQLEWEGSCAGGDSYIIRAIHLRTQVVEVHVDRRALRGPDLEPAFLALLRQIRLLPTAP